MVARLREDHSVAVILAAGSGTRLGEPSKPLALVARLTLLERAVATLQRAGVGRVIVVVGHAKDEVERFVRERELQVELVENEDFAAGNGSSAIVGGRAAGQRFLLMMADHLLEPEVVERMLSCGAPFAVAVDTRPRNCELEDATKLRVHDGRVVAVSRELEDWNAIDAGVFACDGAVVHAAEQAMAAGEGTWNAVKRHWIADGHRLDAVDVAGLFWIDVDTPEDVQRAERLLLRQASAKPLDGPVARQLNRRFSRPISLLLIRLGIAPNLVTVASFVLTCLAAGVLAAGATATAALVVGGVLVQAASVFDGCDGEVARATLRTSPAGAFLDATLDRVGDAAVLVALAVAAGLDSVTWAALAAALFGSLLAPYVKAAYEAAFSSPFPAGAIRFGAGRDVRLLLIAVSAVTLEPLWGLIVVAALANLEAARRAVAGWRVRAGR